MKEDRLGTDKCPIAIYETCVKCPYFYGCEGRYSKVENQNLKESIEEARSEMRRGECLNYKDVFGGE